ncbi:MAG TPA: 4Fe-4S double cluster binding domain-containing protein [Acidimicrobiia bacterium]|nr:4Fe-4S double cluster binding domain-containing protein [Acidimicrobiia bacterium]
MRDGLKSTSAPYPWVIETTTTARLERIATDLGAVSFGVTDASPFRASRSTLQEHRGNGMSGPLHFTYTEPEIATDVTRTFPWARRIVVFAHGYLGGSHHPATTGPVVGRFATKDQYAGVRGIAEGLARALTADGARAETLIDDNRLVDRAAAARSGVGWLGKSTMLLAPGHGPWLLLGSVVTDAELETTLPMRRSCGTCAACIPACPTAAITPDGLDARLCISTWLQAPGAIPHWIRPLIERRIYGCDDCLTSCPPGFPTMERTDSDPLRLSFAELLDSSDEHLIDRFGWFYVPQRQPRFLRRNLLVAAGNSEEAEAVGPILDHFTHRSSLVRGHAYWALARSLGEGAWTPLRRRYSFETVPDALVELERAMLMLRMPHGG